MKYAAKYNGVPGCPRVTVLSIDGNKRTAIVLSDEAEPGHESLEVPLGELSSFQPVIPTSDDLPPVARDGLGKFVLEIEPGNEAMQTGEDVAEALSEIAEYIRTSEPTAWNGEATIRDANGNSVGRWTFHDFN